MRLIYALLARAEIRGNNGVVLYKRIHSDCASSGVQTLTTNKNFASKIWELFCQSSEGFKIQELRNYSSLSTGFERAILITLFPLSLIYIIGEKLNLTYIIREKIRNNRRFFAK